VVETCRSEAARHEMSRTLLALTVVFATCALVSCRSETHSAAASPPPVDAAAVPTDAELAARHEEYEKAYRRGVSLMETYMLVPHRDVHSDRQAQADLHAAIAALDVALRIDPNSSSAWWARGKASQLLGDHEEAYASFHRSFKIDAGNNPDSGVQLVLECLETGRGGEAVEVAQGISKTQPDNAGMLANLALAYLINGQIDDAVRAANAATALDPEDPATESAKRRVDDVKSGRRPRPQHISDLLLR
jgi:tetratricopeptide (TPR) repeat protein